MKVDPPLFPQSLGQTSAPARPSADATEARKVTDVVQDQAIVFAVSYAHTAT
jgi:hypothetical protein